MLLLIRMFGEPLVIGMHGLGAKLVRSSLVVLCFFVGTVTLLHFLLLLLLLPGSEGLNWKSSRLLAKCENEVGCCDRHFQRTVADLASEKHRFHFGECLGNQDQKSLFKFQDMRVVFPLTP